MDKPPEFYEAVEFAREAIARLNVNGESLPEMHVRTMRNVDGGNVSTETIEKSKELRHIWDYLNLLAQELLREGKPLPSKLAEWVADVLDGRRPRPSKQGSPSNDMVRNINVISVVELLVDQGMKATRSYKRGGTLASKEGRSACDAVGFATSMTYRNVAKIWENRISSPVPQKK